MKSKAAAALVVVAIAAAWWGHAAYQKHQLRQAVLALVAEATARMGSALEAPSDDADDLRRLENHFRALASAQERLASLQEWRDAKLGMAAQRYLDEAHALLRRRLAERRAAEAVRIAAEDVAAHLRSPRGRSTAWISRALALKQAMERGFFDWRLASGGLEKSLQTLREARGALATLVAPLPLLDERTLVAARERHAAEAKALEQVVEVTRRLPESR